jgi:flagellar biosynthesis protein FliR
MVLALGLSLIFAGMVTSLAVGILGLLLTIAGIVGWFCQVLPHEAHESVPITSDEVDISSSRTLIQRPTRHASDTPRKILPVETFLIGNGIKGGLAGGAAMTIPATLFSLIKYHSLWYAVNLLAAGGFVGWAGASDAFLSQFHLQGLLAALLIHCLTSLLVGLLYGAMLPMFPRYPIVTAGFMAPLLLTGIIYSALNILSPILNQRIDWFWFILSQLAFGLVCGFVVNLQTKVRTPQFQALPFALRAGLHSDQEELPQSPVNPTDKTAKEDGRP